MSIQLVVKSDSLTKTRSNSPVWGQVYLQGDGYAFPAPGWTDIAAGFCLYWIQALQKIEVDRAQSVCFMDGPYKVTMRLVTDDSVELNMLECRARDQVRQKAIGSLQELLQGAVFNAQNILRTAEQNRWIDGDIKALASILADIKLRYML